jgi:hypothetical protein
MRLSMRPAVCWRTAFLDRIRKNAVDTEMRMSAAEKQRDGEGHYIL